MKFMKRIKFIFKFWKFGPFLVDFFLSKQVSLFKKLFAVLFVVAYAFFPFDLIPDVLLFFGIVDDLVLATFVLERIVKLSPPALKEKYDLI
ncbi:DUF1232 domain-containing protein [Bacillus sp. HMF5848]|nr:DUF1232 domain-containing protein [Bacillus sp. HMF5848]